MVSGFNFPSVCLCVCMHLYVFICVCARTKPSTYPTEHVSAPCLVLSTDLIYYTQAHTPRPLLLDEIIKVRLHRLWLLRKHRDVFHPPKGQ